MNDATSPFSVTTDIAAGHLPDADAARLLADAESYARMIGLATQLLPAWQPMLAQELARAGCPVHAMRVDQLAGCVLRVLTRAGRRLG